MGKGKIDLVEQSKAIDERPQRLKAVVKKIQVDDISSSKKELQDSGNNGTNFTSEKDSLDSDFY